MNCQFCNTPNADDAKFCTNCGRSLMIAPAHVTAAASPNKDWVYLLILLGWDYFERIAFLILNKVVIEQAYKSTEIGKFDRVGLIIKVFNYGFAAITVVLAIIFATVVRNTTARILLIIFGVIQIIVTVGSYIHL